MGVEVSGDSCEGMCCIKLTTLKNATCIVAGCATHEWFSMSTVRRDEFCSKSMGCKVYLCQITLLNGVYIIHHDVMKMYVLSTQFEIESNL